MKTTTINIGDTVEIVNVHPADVHINNPIFRPGARGVVLTQPRENIEGYFSGDIEFIKGNPRFFFAVKIRKVPAEPKPAPQPGDQSQNGRILKRLQSGASINPMQALRLFNCWSLAQRIHNLKGMGYEIESMPGYNPRTKKRYSVYFLKSEL